MSTLTGNDIGPSFLSFLGKTTKNINLFSCIINWFKFNCIFQLQELFKGGVGGKEEINQDDIQTLFATNQLIIGSYTLMKYYITQIILANLDVCQLTSELQTFIDILSPNDTDLKNIMPQSIQEKEKEGDNTSSDNKSRDSKDKPSNSNEPDTKKLSYNVQVQVKVKKISGDKDGKEKLNSNNINEYLGCKNRDLQFQFNKLKQSAGILTGDISGYISKKTATLSGPNISQLEENLKLPNDNNSGMSDDEYTRYISTIKSLFYDPDYIQIKSSVNLSENRAVENQDNFFVSVNKLVYAVNKQASKPITQSESDDLIDNVINTRIFGVYDTLYTLQD